MLLCCCGWRNRSLSLSYFFYKYFLSFCYAPALALVAARCSWHLNGAFSKQNVAKTQRQVGENEPSSRAGRQAGREAGRRHPAVCHSVPRITVELCIELCSKDASCVYSYCNYKTDRQGERLASFIVMALMKMLLQSFAGLARAFYIN